MSRSDGLSEWTATVSSHMPHLTVPQARLLAWWSSGIAFTRCCGRLTVATFLALLLGRKVATVEQRVYEWCLDAPAKAGEHRQALDVTTCFVPLLGWIIRLWHGTQLALTIDATPLSDRFVALGVSVVYRGCAIPVAWTILPAGRKRAWRTEWLRMLRLLQPAIPSTWTVVVLADRGLYARWLYRHICALGWHPLLRINQSCKFRPQGHARFVWLRELCGQPGGRWRGAGTAFASSRCRLPCTLVAWWGEGHREPWFVLTDLAPDGCDAQWYGLRGWGEQGFKVLKRGGWQWQHTQMRDPARVARLWLALAVATVWMISVGSAVELGPPLDAVGLPDVQALLGQRAPQQPRRLRLFRLGWLWLLVAAIRGQRVPRPTRLVPEPWPEIPQPLSSWLPLHKRLSYAYM